MIPFDDAHRAVHYPPDRTFSALARCADNVKLNDPVSTECPSITEYLSCVILCAESIRVGIPSFARTVRPNSAGPGSLYQVRPGRRRRACGLPSTSWRREP